MPTEPLSLLETLGSRLLGFWRNEDRQAGPYVYGCFVIWLEPFGGSVCACDQNSKRRHHKALFLPVLTSLQLSRAALYYSL